MKVIIAGSRSIKDSGLVNQAMDRCGFDVTEVICGMATGVDTLGYRWAQCNNKKIIEMPANWNKYGKAAGPIRNRQMAEECDCAVIVWDGESPGARNMIDEMIRVNKPYFIQMTKSTVENFYE